MIPADRFYDAMIAPLQEDRRFSFVRGRVERIVPRDDHAVVVGRALPPAGDGDDPRWRSLAGAPGSGTAIVADVVVDSVFGPSHADASGAAVGVQAFVGWEVESDRPIWDSGTATLMDFGESGGDDVLEFTYVLPFTAHRALVEHTVVAEVPPSDGEIEDRLGRYLDEHTNGADVQIRRREKGHIPLLPDRRPQTLGPVVHLGVVAGAARPSTGYAFRSIVETSQAVAQQLAAGIDGRVAEAPAVPVVAHATGRPRFFDRVFLALILATPAEVPRSLVMLFRNNPTDRVFRFLHGSSSVIDELMVILSLPWPPFLRALGRIILPVRRARRTSSESIVRDVLKEQT